MAVRSPQQAGERDLDDEFDEDYDGQLALALEYLAKRGVKPDPKTGQFREEDLIEAIRARGWEPEVRRVERWDIVVTDPSGVMDEDWAVGSGQERATALMAALRELVTYLTPEESRERFDREARAMLGISADEFVRRAAAKELDFNDPRVIYVSMAARHVE